LGEVINTVVYLNFVVIVVRAVDMWKSLKTQRRKGKNEGERLLKIVGVFPQYKQAKKISTGFSQVFTEYKESYSQ